MLTLALELQEVVRTGASGLMASSISIDHGSTSYSTSISSQLRRIASVVARGSHRVAGNSASRGHHVAAHPAHVLDAEHTDLSTESTSRAGDDGLDAGSASAFAVSIDLMRPCGCLRSTCPICRILVSGGEGRRP